MCVFLNWRRSNCEIKCWLAGSKSIRISYFNWWKWNKMKKQTNKHTIANWLSHRNMFKHSTEKCTITHYTNSKNKKHRKCSLLLLLDEMRKYYRARDSDKKKITNKEELFFVFHIFFFYECRNEVKKWIQSKHICNLYIEI